MRGFWSRLLRLCLRLLFNLYRLLCLLQVWRLGHLMSLLRLQCMLSFPRLRHRALQAPQISALLIPRHVLLLLIPFPHPLPHPFRPSHRLILLRRPHLVLLKRRLPGPHISPLCPQAVPSTRRYKFRVRIAAPSSRVANRLWLLFRLGKARGKGKRGGRVCWRGLVGGLDGGRIVEGGVLGVWFGVLDSVVHGWSH